MTRVWRAGPRGPIGAPWRSSCAHPFHPRYPLLGFRVLSSFAFARRSVAVLQPLQLCTCNVRFSQARGVAAGAAIRPFGRDCVQQSFRAFAANKCLHEAACVSHAREVVRCNSWWLLRLRITTCQMSACPLGVSVPWAHLGLRFANARNAINC